ncbi:hypothetical protein BJV82DRAFT_585768 [Fennellomyces sp. T-0311]|nr:hypothetical protein BJV82DRAFT_585768 [Fennellomyces sp. T-0311]
MCHFLRFAFFDSLKHADMGANLSRIGVYDSNEIIDFGSTRPQGLYPDSPIDYDVKAVKRFMREGKLAPFYQGLNDPLEFSITADQETALAITCCPGTAAEIPDNEAIEEAEKQPSIRKQSRESILYKRITECPICFLYYPIYINYTRCCDKPICTECFLQLKRSSECPLVPAQCPFCVQANFGVIHVPPKFSSHYKQFSKRRTDLIQYAYGDDNKIRPRRNNRLGPNDPDVILSDEVRPDWQSVYLHCPVVQHMSGIGTTRRVIVRPNGEHVSARRRLDESTGHDLSIYTI